MKIQEYKLDIFNCLSQINKKNIHFYDNLPEENKKGFLPLIVMRWLYRSPHELQVILLNQIVNPYIFSLGKHPRLIYKLMTTTAVQANTNYIWKSKKQEINLPMTLGIIAKFYNISKREAKLHLDSFTSEDIFSMGEDIGMQIEDLKKLKQELKKI